MNISGFVGEYEDFTMGVVGWSTLYFHSYVYCIWFSFKLNEWCMSFGFNDEWKS